MMQWYISYGFNIYHHMFVLRQYIYTIDMSLLWTRRFARFVSNFYSLLYPTKYHDRSLHGLLFLANHQMEPLFTFSSFSRFSSTYTRLEDIYVTLEYNNTEISAVEVNLLSSAKNCIPKAVFVITRNLTMLMWHIFQKNALSQNMCNEYGRPTLPG